MFRKKMNRFRKQFAYDGQEDEVNKIEIHELIVRNVTPPFDVDLFPVEGYMVTWRGITTMKLIEHEVNQPQIIGMLLEGGSFVLQFKDVVGAERVGNQILLTHPEYIYQ